MLLSLSLSVYPHYSTTPSNFTIYYFDLLFSSLWGSSVCVCLCVVFLKKKTQYLFVCVSHKIKAAFTKACYSSSSHTFIRPLIIQLEAIPKHSCVTRDSLCYKSCSLVVFFRFLFCSLYIYISLLYRFLRFAPHSMLCECLCLFLLLSFASCNRIKWRMISYFLTSNYTTAVLICVMRWKRRNRTGGAKNDCIFFPRKKK